jgi:predicted DNA-binding antitoxin AbrB/MazE fold protein
MNLLDPEGIIEQGQIKLKNKIHLQENTKVHVILSELKVDQALRIFSPRLAHPEEAELFKMAVFEEPADAQ